MKPIFKTGTFLTAKNLNIAQRVSGLSGIIEGCDIFSSSTLLLGIAKGIAKLDDGTVIEFEGDESIDMFDKEDGDYHICIIKYSEHNIVFDVVKTIPEYKYLELAKVIKDGNSIEIINSPKSSINYIHRNFDISYLKEYFNGNIDIDENGLRYCQIKVLNTQSTDIASGEFNFSFIADSPVSYINIRGIIENPNEIAFSLLVNNEEKNIKGKISYWDINIANGYKISIPYDYINTNDIVNLKLTLFNAYNSEATANIYEIILN